MLITHYIKILLDKFHKKNPLNKWRIMHSTHNNSTPNPNSVPKFKPLSPCLVKLYLCWKNKCLQFEWSSPPRYLKQWEFNAPFTFFMNYRVKISHRQGITNNVNFLPPLLKWCNILSNETGLNKFKKSKRRSLR